MGRFLSFVLLFLFLGGVSFGGVEEVFREAYVWGWPMAYLHQCRSRLEMVPRIGRSGGLPVAPVNRLAMLTSQVVPRTSLVPCPSRDVLYGFGIFDLGLSPVVIQVPDFGGRFWLYQLGDHRTDSFAEVGSMHGTLPGFYLVVGPDWSGEAPRGMSGAFRSPTRLAYCIPRIFFTSEDGDRAAAVEAADGVAAYPLSEFTGRPVVHEWERLGWLPSLSGRGGLVTPEVFVDVLPCLLEDIPPLPGERPLYERISGALELLKQDEDFRSSAVAAIRDVERDVVAPLFEFRNFGTKLPGGWSTVLNGAEFGTDYLTRTAVARSNIFVNRHRETKYYYLDLDSSGRRLNGDGRYLITFPKDCIPPAGGFWSLTAYDSRHLFPAATAELHSIGSRDLSLELGSDGSLTIVVEPSESEDIIRGNRNRIMAPPGPFSLYLRLYAPLMEAMDGRWIPPAVHRCQPAIASDPGVQEHARRF